MIPHAFRIGNNVEVIGPSITGNDIHLGKRFKIECMYVNPSQHIQFEPYDGTYYPASSLRLVEPELKIGDWVEVVGSPKYFPQYPAKTIFCIIKGPPECKGILGFGGIRNCVDCYCGEGTPFYEANSLRKLTPDEIKAHLHPIRVSATMDCSEFAEGMAKCQDKLWKIGIEARLSAIEKQQKEQHEKISQFDGEISHLMGSIQECLMESGDVEARTRCREMAIEKRLEFVEKFQREQDDRVNRAIRDGAVQIFDFRRKT